MPPAYYSWHRHCLAVGPLPRGRAWQRERWPRCETGSPWTALHLTLFFTDIKTLLTRAVWKLCGEELAAKANDSGYTNDLSPPTRHGVRFPLSAPTIMYRLRCDVWRTIFVPKLCFCAGRWSRPTMLFLSVPQWRVTLKLLLISFDCLICRRISPVCVVSVTTRGGVWRWTQPSWYLPLVRLLTSRVCLLPRSIVPVSVSAHVPGVQLLGPAVPQSKTYSPFLFFFLRSYCVTIVCFCFFSLSL